LRASAFDKMDARSIASHPPDSTTPSSAMAARRTALMLLLTMAAGWSFAQAPARTAPIPQPPPPPPDVISDPDLEPQVTILRREDQVVEEVRTQGQLRYIRVTPRHGRPYFLIPDTNGTTFIRRDSLDSSLKVPMWVLFSF
jgi:hypothetical protein